MTCKKNGIAKKYNLYVIEDAAEAFMSKKQKFWNNWRWGFTTNKIITSGQVVSLLQIIKNIMRR